MVQNDHKPLEMIQQKTIHVAPPDFSRCFCACRSMKYDYTIQYKPVKEMMLANWLSHFSSHSNSLPIPIRQNVQHIQLFNADLDIIWGSMECNPVYSTISCLSLRGWPECRQQVPQIAIHLWGAQDELSIDVGLLLKGTRVCIPLELLDCTLEDLHGAHQGVDRMHAQAKKAVYLPSRDADITSYVCQCTICTKHKAPPPAQPMLPRDITNAHGRRLAVDYLTHKGREYLLVCSLFSKYPFLYKVSTKWTQSLYMCLKELIMQYGLPCPLYTDNGPPFMSKEFAQFLQCNCTDPITSSSHFPRSNGFHRMPG